MTILTVWIRKTGRHQLVIAGIRDKNLLDQICRELPETCRELGVITNAFTWRWGIQAALKSKRVHQNVIPDEIPEAEWGGRAEAHSKRGLYRLYDSIVTGRKVFQKEISFEEWLDFRDRVRTDLWFLAVDVLKIPLEECVHRVLSDQFYPRLNFNGVYHKDYTLTEVHAAISQQAEIKTWLQLDPRTYMKSALFSAFALQFAYCVPDCRILVLSGTDPLAEQFLRIMKSYLARFEGDPSAANLLFPEYSLTGIDATSEEPILLPCRKHSQRNWSIWTAGLMGSGSGAHADLCGADDIVQEEGNEHTRLKLKNKADNLLQNVPDPHALKFFQATRYHEQDYYQGLIDLWESDPTTMHYICRAVWTPKEGFSHYEPELLTLDQVDLLWPNRAGSPEKTFAAIHRALLLNKYDTLHQLFNSPVSSEASETVQFTEGLLTSSVRPLSSFPPGGDKYLCLDIAYSTSKRADFSAIGAVQIAPNDAGRASMFVHDMFAGRLVTTDLAYKCAEMNWRFRPKSFLVEAFSTYELFIDKIFTECDRRGWPRPNFVKIPIDTTANSKFLRIKPLQILLEEKRLIFAQGDFLGLAFDHFMRYDGTRSNAGKKKDDLADVLGTLAKHVLPRDESDEKTAKQAKDNFEEAERQRIMQEQHSMIFGGGGSQWHVSTGSQWGKTPTEPTPSEEQSNHPFRNIPGWSNYTQSRPGGQNLPRGFGDLKPRNQN